LQVERDMVEFAEGFRLFLRVPLDAPHVPDHIAAVVTVVNFELSAVVTRDIIAASVFAASDPEGFGSTAAAVDVGIIQTVALFNVEGALLEGLSGLDAELIEPEAMSRVRSEVSALSESRAKLSAAKDVIAKGRVRMHQFHHLVMSLAELFNPAKVIHPFCSVKRRWDSCLGCLAGAPTALIFPGAAGTGLQLRDERCAGLQDLGRQFRGYGCSTRMLVAIAARAIMEHGPRLQVPEIQQSASDHFVTSAGSPQQYAAPTPPAGREDKSRLTDVHFSGSGVGVRWSEAGHFAYTRSKAGPSTLHYPCAARLNSLPSAAV
jgi:hypothetical protein